MVLAHTSPRSSGRVPVRALSGIFGSEAVRGHGKLKCASRCVFSSVSPSLTTIDIWRSMVGVRQADASEFAKLFSKARRCKLTILFVQTQIQDQHQESKQQIASSATTIARHNHGYERTAMHARQDQYQDRDAGEGGPRKTQVGVRVGRGGMLPMHACHLPFHQPF